MSKTFCHVMTSPVWQSELLKQTWRLYRLLLHCLSVLFAQTHGNKCPHPDSSLRGPCERP
eukprot:4736853-Amphidinium_carterae.1